MTNRALIPKEGEGELKRQQNKAYGGFVKDTETVFSLYKA